MATFNTGQLQTVSLGTATPTTYAATTTAGNPLAANTNRKRFLVLNKPSNTVIIYIGFAAGVTASNGIPLAPGQGWIDDISPVHTGVVSALSASGTADLLVWEWQ